MFDGLDDRALKIVVQARDETLRLGHDYIGTEHLVLALLAEEDMAAARSLESLGGIEPLVGSSKELTTTLLPLTPPAQKALRVAVIEAPEFSGRSVAPEHLLLGLMRVRRSVAVRVLSDLGVRLTDLRREVGRAFGGNGRIVGGG